MKGLMIPPGVPRFFVLGLAVTALVGCVEYHDHDRAGYPPPPPPLPAYVQPYDYVYYPDTEVYYCQQTQFYFWFEAGGWRSGPHCPRTIVLRPETRVVVRLNTREPWREHERIRATYPRPIPRPMMPGPAAKYRYQYYPSAETYYRPDSHTYYWRDQGAWRTGQRPPPHANLRAQERVEVNLDSPEPSRHHEEVRAQHPGHGDDRGKDKRHDSD